MKIKTIIIAIALSMTLATALHAADAPQETPQQRDARMAWWREAKFGMFIHWGVYSMLGGEHKGKRTWTGGEWIQNGLEIPVAEYADLAKGFNPTNFNAEAWVLLAKETGVKYMVVTTKHHDGFAMFKSEASPFNLVDWTPFKRDAIRELADACRKHGMKLGFYYSQAQDWHQPGAAQYRINKRKTAEWDDAQRGSTDDYVNKIAVSQVRELLTNYGDVAVFWWDSPMKLSKQNCSDLAALMKLQPHIITNNRLGNGFHGDTATPEQKIPTKAMPGDWETCMTINDTWGYKYYDTKWKSAQQLVRNLVDIVSKGGNYLLNIGPDGLGNVPEPSIQRLREIGAWLKVNGEAIYGTTATPFGDEFGTFSKTKLDKKGKPVFEPHHEWRCTQKPGKLYIHIFQWPTTGKFELPAVKDKIVKAYLLADPTRAALAVQQTDAGVSITLPAKASDAIATVICMEARNP